MPVNIAASFPLADKDGGTFNRYDSYNLTSTSEYTTDKINVTGVLNYNSNVNKLAVDADNQSVGTVNVYATERVKFSAFSGEVRRSEEHTSELQSLMRISYAVFCLKKKKK